MHKEISHPEWEAQKPQENQVHKVIRCWHEQVIPNISLIALKK